MTMHDDHAHELTRGDAWWLEPGAERCAACEVQLHYETQTHCFECDSPLCPVCITTVLEKRRVVCTECNHDETEDS